MNSVKENDGFAFDTALVWVAGLNVISHLIASQSARLLDASAGVAELVNAISYIVLLGATLLDNATLFRQVRTLAISDSLTGLANYRHLVDVLQSELERSGRTNRPFSVLLMDLDGLKKINDRHGHVIGSRALCRVATILRLNSRSIDTAARYGGDEFALVLPETNALCRSSKWSIAYGIVWWRMRKFRNSASASGSPHFRNAALRFNSCWSMRIGLSMQ